MKNTLFAIFLCCFLASCGGGGGAVGDVSASAQDTAHNFVSSDLMLQGDRFRVVVDGTEVDLPHPSWKDDFTSGVDGIVDYVAVRSDDFVAVAGIYDDTPFARVTGDYAVPATDQSVTYQGKIVLHSGETIVSTNMDLTLHMGWSIPRLLGNLPAHQLDVSASMDAKGALSGTVGYSGSYADLTGGVFGQSDLGAAFAGSEFYGVIKGTRVE
ncbi:hypothetical protein N9A67_01730 [Rhodobacteraceae bacterium]|nr:hypothetical protein [Paracoccaceae bacterium]